MAPTEPRDLRQYTKSWWRRRWLILSSVALATGATLVISTSRTSQYVATAKVFIGPRTIEKTDVSAALEELTFSREFVASYVELLRGRALAERVVERHSLTISAVSLAEHVDARIVPDTRIIEVSVKDISADRAQMLANALVDAFVFDVQQDFGGRAGVQASVLESALRPARPVSPMPARDAVLGGLLGLLLGLGVAALREQTDTRIRSHDDANEALAPLPVLAAIPRVPRRDRECVVVNAVPRSPAAEAFRILRTSVWFLGVERPLRRVLVTSPYAADGKTTVAANLAASMAAAGHRTVLLEADLRRPSAHDYFGIAQSPGMTDVLVGVASLGEALRATSIPNLSVLPAGMLPPNPSELLGGKRMTRLLKQVSEEADLVIVDSPPALPVTDALVLAGHLDGILLVLKCGWTHRDGVRDAVTAFQRVGVRVLGAVIVGGRTSPDGRHYHYYRLRKRNRLAHAALVGEREREAKPSDRPSRAAPFAGSALFSAGNPDRLLAESEPPNGSRGQAAGPDIATQSREQGGTRAPEPRPAIRSEEGREEP